MNLLCIDVNYRIQWKKMLIFATIVDEHTNVSIIDIIIGCARRPQRAGAEGTPQCRKLQQMMHVPGGYEQL